MPVNLNDAEYFADKILQRVDQLINERNTLRDELARRSKGTLTNEKDFVRAYKDGVISGASASEKIMRLEHILMLS